MTDNTKGLLHIFINVLVWSFFPLFSVQSAGASPWAALFYSQVAGLVFALIFAKRKPARAIAANRQPGRCCDSGCTPPSKTTMVALPARRGEGGA